MDNNFIYSGTARIILHEVHLAMHYKLIDKSSLCNIIVDNSLIIISLIIKIIIIRLLTIIVVNKY